MKYYLSRFLLVAIMACSSMLCSCAYFSQYKNQKNAAQLRVGMTKAEVLAVMGEPLRDEVFNKPDTWYYYIDTKWHDTYTTQDECMPLSFKKGKLVGWGQDYYNRNYFAGKPVN
jgi:outer membrane protein assembly factor BamE (lipoprotein component of BamABCDE complex)